MKSLKVVWPEVVVSEGVLTTHICDLRQALGDKAKAPRYIETVHRRGHRFIASLRSAQQVVNSQSSVGQSIQREQFPDRPLRTGDLTTPVIGREVE